MDSDSIWQILALVVLLLMSAFFSASETALMGASRIKLRQKIDEGSKSAVLVERLLSYPDKLLSAILVGNNVVNIAASALATSLAIDKFGNKGVGIATGIMTLLVLIFSEITPKSLAASKSEVIASIVARPIFAVMVVLKPIVFILSGFTNVILFIFGISNKNDQPQVTEEELKTMMDVSHEEGVLESDEKRLLERVFEFGDEQVRYVMIPRTEIQAISIEDGFEEIRSAFEKARFSRLPVYEDSLDNIVGILHIKDFYLHDHISDYFSLQEIIRKPYYTIESKRIADLFEEMRSKRQQMAVVVDEYGGTAGIVTTQDIVEVIFGDIDDEHDLDDDDIKQIADNEFLVKGSIRLKELNDSLDISLDSEESDTIGGLIIEKLGTFPTKGESVKIDGLFCQVMERTRTKITRVRIKLCSSSENSEGNDCG